MNRHIAFTDCHITEKSIPELEGVFQEILKYSKEAPCLVCVGDYYDKKNATPREIDFGTKWAMKFKQAFKDFYMVTGNHPDVDGVISSVSYLSYLGITVVEDIELDGTYYGHFMVTESAGGWNESRQGSELLDAYRLSVLGHQHNYQEIGNDGSRIIHPGSVRYVDFGEVTDKNKYILLVDDCTYRQIRLTKCRPMFEVNTTKDLTKYPKDAMIRVVINDFNQFLAEANDLEVWKDKFFEFKVKIEFNSTPSPIQYSTASNNDLISRWVNDIDNLEVKEEIIRELEKANLC